jgi:hypothetical protein
MAWTNPRTWVTSEVVTAAMLNTHVRDNLNTLRAHHGCSLYKSADQSVANGANDVVTFNSELYDTDTLHDTATNNSRITVPAGFDGYWRFTGKIQLNADASNHGTYEIRFRKNAAGSSSGGTLIDLMTTQCALVATDYIELFFKSTTEARTIQGTAASNSWFMAEFLGA